MAKQNVPTQPPTRTDEQIVPRSQWLTIGKSNLLFNAQNIQKNPISYISDILIYKVDETIEFDSKLLKKSDLLRKALAITPVIPAQPFELPPAGNLKFVPKGESVEVFGMAIPDPLITEAIQQSSYYPKYLERLKFWKRNKKRKRKGDEADNGTAIKLSLDPAFLPQGRAPIGGVTIIFRDLVLKQLPKRLKVVGKGKAIVTEEQNPEAMKEDIRDQTPGKLHVSHAGPNHEQHGWEEFLATKSLPKDSTTIQGQQTVTSTPASDFSLHDVLTTKAVITGHNSSINTEATYNPTSLPNHSSHRPSAKMGKIEQNS
ncbi:hypothetical protein Tco_0214114 [Tanacetum coccineum]